MGVNIIDEIEEKCEIDLNWFYHSIYYNKAKYIDILTEGIKCNELLNNLGGGRFNGKYYISLSKITIPDNICFLSCTTDTPSFIIDGIVPIKCENTTEYWEYVNTSDPRRISHFDEEYQYYYFIQNTYIKGIVYNLLECFIKSQNKFNKRKIEELLELINILEKFGISIPIYDYSRRDKMLAHEINKEKFKDYSTRFTY